jgi:hypothetical protein
MLYDIRHRLPTEIDFLCGAIAHEAERTGVPAPLPAAPYRLIKAKEFSWNWEGDTRKAAAPGAAHISHDGLRNAVPHRHR